MRSFRELHNPRRPNDGKEEESEPLAGLRRRCTIGAFGAAAIFLAAFVTDIVRHTPRDDMIVSGVEMAAVGIGALCGVVAIVTWLLTENTRYALAIWKVSSHAQASADDPWSGRNDRGMADTVEIKAVPINHGREIRQRRHGQRAG